MDFVPWTSLDRIVVKYGGDVRVRSLRCTEQFRTMAFAQMTYRESLRDIEACLRARPSKLYGMGLRGAVAKSTLADANELRDWRMWSDLAAVLIRRARKLYATQDFGIDLANTVYALDSTTIDLCLSLFPWADFRSTKAAVKMHTLLDLRGPIPSFIHVSVGKMGDARALDMIAPEAGSIYVMDRGYVDFRRLNVFHRAGAFFVTRAKRNMNYHRVYSRAVDKTTGVRADQSVALNGFYTRKDYPQHMRRISFCDPETGKRLVFLTNNFVLPAETFFSLAECNAAIALVMQRMNERPMRKLGVSRRELFEKIERDALNGLPADDWEFAEWRRARVNLDYHIEVHDFLYSVPHTLIRAEVDVRITARTVEIFHRGQRVGAHQRRYMGRKHGTDPGHMPSSHRRYAEWTPDRFRRWAGKIGPSTEGLIIAVLASRPHPEQGFRTCLGILRSYRGVDPAHVEAVSARALELGALNCKSVASLLAQKRDKAAAQDGSQASLFDHANVRGPGYYPDFTN